MTNVIKRTDWLGAVIYPLTVVLMETFWLYPVLVWAGFWPMFVETRPILSIPAIIIVLVVSLAVTRITTKRGWPMWTIQATVIGTGVLVILAVLRFDYSGAGTYESGWFAYIGDMLNETFAKPYTITLALPVLVYLWWRGIQLGRAISYFNSIYHSFLVGMGAFILLLILWEISSAAKDNIEGPIADIGLYVIAFFFFGLAAITICQVYEMRRRMPTRDAKASIWRSLPIMLGVIGGIIVIGFVAASLLSSEFFSTAGSVLGTINDALYKAFVWLMVKIDFIFEGLFWLIKWLLNLMRRTPPPEGEEGAGPGASPFEGMEQGMVEIPEILMTAFRWTVIIAIVAVIVYILVRAINRYRGRRNPDEIEEIHESLWNRNELKNDLRQVLNMMGNMFRRKPKPAAVYFDDSSGSLNVREIYKRLLWESSRQGLGRRGHETPAEYEARLEKYLPDGKDPLEEITNMYSEVRYGDIELKKEKLDEANGIWPALRGLVRRIRG